jgi:hypothetical protein
MRRSIAVDQRGKNTDSKLAAPAAEPIASQTEEVAAE